MHVHSTICRDATEIYKHVTEFTVHRGTDGTHTHTHITGLSQLSAHHSFLWVPNDGEISPSHNIIIASRHNV